MKPESVDAVIERGIRRMNLQQSILGNITVDGDMVVGVWAVDNILWLALVHADTGETSTKSFEDVQFDMSPELRHPGDPS